MKPRTAMIGNFVNFSDAFGYIAGAWQKEKMLFVEGDPGVGKTTTAEYFVEQTHGILVGAINGMTKFGLVKEILKGMQSTCRGYEAGLRKAVDMLKEQRCPIFIDEVDLLDAELITTLRRIHDLAGVPVIMFGETGALNKLYRHRRLRDRIHLLQFKDCDLHDITVIANTCCEVEVAEDLLRKIYGETEGRLRLIVRCLGYVEEHAKALDLKVCTEADWGNQPLIPMPANLSIPGFTPAKGTSNKTSSKSKRRA